MKNNSILDSLKKIYTKMTGKKVVKRKTETDVLSDIADSYDPNQGGGGSTVTGTDDGTNWTSLTIDDKTRAIPQGGGSGGLNIAELEEPTLTQPGVEVEVLLTEEQLNSLRTADMIKSTNHGFYFVKESEYYDNGSLVWVSFVRFTIGPTYANGTSVEIRFDNSKALWVYNNLQISAES